MKVNTVRYETMRPETFQMGEVEVSVDDLVIMGYPPTRNGAARYLADIRRNNKDVSNAEENLERHLQTA